LFILISSALLTHAAIKLRRQVLDDTLSRIVDPVYPSEGEKIEITGIEVGRVVVALTWTAVALMCVNLGVWMYLLVSGLKRQRGKDFELNRWGGTNKTVESPEGQAYKMKSTGGESTL
jgi:hypothetical protein